MVIISNDEIKKASENCLVMSCAREVCISIHEKQIKKLRHQKSSNRNLSHDVLTFGRCIRSEFSEEDLPEIWKANNWLYAAIKIGRCELPTTKSSEFSD